MSSEQPFVKMHGLGNDFVLLDGVSQSPPPLSPSFIQQLADRRYGIGFDQLLLLQPPAKDKPDSDFFYRIFNADGSEVGQCGNGVRCAHLFLLQRGLTTQQQLTFDTMTTRIQTQVVAPNRVRAVMPAAQFLPQQQAHGYTFNHLLVGNPHYVCFVDTLIDEAAHAQIGKALNDTVAGGVNVGFAVVGADGIQLRVYERGAGLTHACGSGALAAAVAAIHGGKSASPVQVTMPGGTLLCGCEADNSVWLEGEVTTVYSGQFAV